MHLEAADLLLVLLRPLCAAYFAARLGNLMAFVAYFAAGARARSEWTGGVLLANVVLQAVLPPTLPKATPPHARPFADALLSTMRTAAVAWFVPGTAWHRDPAVGAALLTAHALLASGEALRCIASGVQGRSQRLVLKQLMLAVKAHIAAAVWVSVAVVDSVRHIMNVGVYVMAAQVAGIVFVQSSMLALLVETIQRVSNVCTAYTGVLRTVLVAAHVAHAAQKIQAPLVAAS
jgi:hypothetical protein